MKYKKACVISKNYPDPWFIERGAFVERLVRVWKSLGISVDVVAPRSIADIIRNRFKKKFTNIGIAGNQIVYPTYLSISNKKLFMLNLNEISRSWFIHAADRGISKIKLPDFFYGQFLLTGGFAAAKAGFKYGLPCYSSLGEFSLIKNLNNKETELARTIVKSLNGIVCVSEELKDEAIELGADPERVQVFPNTVDLNRFKPLSKTECRKKLGLPTDDKLCIFVGHFIERKGPLRVLKAVNHLNDPSLKCIFIGRGNQRLYDESICYQGPIPNAELPYWLNASDLFILPTLDEGHCNAINEAMACALPVISSNIPAIQHQIPDGAGLLTDPKNIDEIAACIKKVITDQSYAEERGYHALLFQKERSIVSRAEKILQWINDQ